ncbi:AAA family ATPase [Allomeiothermus silvanus]|uniref:AAA family ATPase n=1 Tax=Allomeiothermus silvanus TaxID=52022 RepID=UPI00019E9142|nr:MoxR family ATPase [Allomeiothermus silvanus]
MKNEIRAVQMGLAAQLPIHLIGIPGVGKTATIEALARAMGRHLEVIIAANRDRTDFGGIPLVKEGKLVLEHLPWVDRLLAAPGGAILFLDEIGGTPPDVRPSLLRVIAERWLGDVFLPPERVAILAASNPTELGEGDGPEAWSLALRTRFVHIRWPAPEVDEFTGAPVAGWKTPEVGDLPTSEEIKSALSEAKALVAGFLRLRPELLAPLPRPGESSLGWPNPRTWERFAASALAVWIAGRRKPEDLGALHLLLTGALGLVGGEFLTWVRSRISPTRKRSWPTPKTSPCPSGRTTSTSAWP